MKEVINAYRAQKINVDSFIKTLIDSLPKNYMAEAPSILKQYRYIQLMYGVNSEFKQITPVMSRKESNSSQIGSDKNHYFMKLHLNENNSFYDKIKRIIFFFGSTSLALVSIALIGYGVFVFFSLMFSLSTADFLHDIFRSIISITLGLAIYDLAKQIFEHEVMFQSFHKSEDKQYKVLGKFLISIIIALSIETLMVVFKIALGDLSNMLSAFYLLMGTTLMFVGLSYFYK